MLTGRDAQIESAIANRDISKLALMFFDAVKGERTIRDGVCHESVLWDYKSEIPEISKSQASEKSWTDIAALVLAFYNSHGGLIFFGVTNSFKVAGIRTRLDSKLLNEKLRRYISDRIWVEFQRLHIQDDQTCIGLVIIPPRSDRMERFVGKGEGFRYQFNARESAERIGDSVKILTEDAVQQRTRQLALPTIDNPYEVDKPNYRLLRPEFSRFVYREKPCREIEAALSDPRTSVISLTGIGGTGKTALATWATQRAFARQDYSFIVSITAKDRALTTSGILALVPQLSNYESLLDSILNVIGWDDYIANPLDEKDKAVRELIKDSNGLLFIDNLETIDDDKIIDFLESLPIGVKAITTSRIPRIKNYVRLVDPGFLTDEEIISFVGSYKDTKKWIAAVKDEDLLNIGRSADGVPLAIEWIIKRASSHKEALSFAKALTETGTKKDELLEFSFRRIFDAMPEDERSVLRTIAAINSPLGLEPIIAATGLGAQSIDVIEKLRDDSLVQRIFDEPSAMYRYTLLSLVRTFVAKDLAVHSDLDRKLRKRLTEWFEATDISDIALRTAERQLRQGKQTSDIMLYELGRQAEDIADLNSAKILYERAFKSGSNWQAAHRLAEIYRHKELNIGEARRWYEKAASFAPKAGNGRALVYREWGNVLKASGEPDAVDLAIAKYEESLRHSENKHAAHSLATLYLKKGVFKKILEFEELLWVRGDVETKLMSRDLFVAAYRHFGDLLKVEELKSWSPKL